MGEWPRCESHYPASAPIPKMVSGSRPLTRSPRGWGSPVRVTALSRPERRLGILGRKCSSQSNMKLPRSALHTQIGPCRLADSPLRHRDRAEMAGFGQQEELCRVPRRSLPPRFRHKRGFLFEPVEQLRVASSRCPTETSSDRRVVTLGQASEVSAANCALLPCLDRPLSIESGGRSSAFATPV